MELLSEEEFMEAQDRYGMSFTAGIGAEAIRTLLENMDLDSLSAELRAKMVEKGPKVDKRLLKGSKSWRTSGILETLRPG
jgi:DNA-directed RNA polymerase subunit beta'